MALVLAGLVVGTLLAIGLALPPEPSLSSYRFTPFATEAVNESQPAWSPDGQTLAYVADVAGTGQIFARAINSPVPAQITKPPAPCSAPFWSPDGARIYYLSRGDLWSVGAVGGAPQLAVKGPHVSASISADGKTLAFMRYQGLRAGLWIRSVADGKEQEYKQAPFPDSFRFPYAPVMFSPDGKKLAVALVKELEAGVDFWIVPYPAGKPWRVPFKSGRLIIQLGGGFAWMPDNRNGVIADQVAEGSGIHLHLLDTKSGATRPITNGVNEEVNPSVSPDGRRIAFAAGGSDWNLVEVSVGGPAVSSLLATARNELLPAWSPSGRQYAYVSDAGGRPEIWLRSSEEGWARPVVAGDQEGSLLISTPRFSPDGQRIAYMKAGARHAILVANLAGGRPVPIDQEAGDQHGPAWSPDGNWVAYARYLGGKWEIAKAPSGGGGQPLRIIDGGDPGTVIDWSPNGETMVYGDPAGLHLVSPDGTSPRTLRKVRPLVWGLSKDGSNIYLLRRPPGSGWELAAINIANGEETKLGDLDLPAQAGVRGFSLHPDGKRFATSVNISKRDIWILEGFQQPARWFGWLRR